MQLTHEQSLATTKVDRDLCLVAGAGTGKTRVLVERFIHLIESGAAQSSEVLAITFTEKAADEMLERLAQRLGSPGLENQISTIHSFCFRFLKFNTKAVKLPKDFKVAQPLVSGQLLSQALDDALMDIERLYPEELLLLLEEISWSGAASLRDRVESLLLPTYGNLRASGWVAGSDFYVAPEAPAIGKSCEVVSQSFSLLYGKVESKKQQEKLAPLFASLDEQRDERQRLLYFSQLLSALGGRWPDNLRADKVELQEKIEAAMCLLAQAVAAPHYKVLADLLDRLDYHYSVNKTQLKFVDYDDLQSKTLHLLQQSSKAQQAVQKKFPFILVDEFQDVSPLQRQLVEKLRSPGQLFFVGDVRQSIYSFRYADIKNFEQMRQSFASKEGQTLALSENFRSTDKIVSLLNDFVTTHKSPLTLGCHAGPDLKAAAAFEQASLVQPQMHLFGGSDSEQARAYEASWVANYLKECFANSEMKISRKGHPRFSQPILYSDVALLFRTSASLPLFESALARVGIPTQAVAAGGFYETRVVQDLLTLLRVRLNPEDDLAMASILKSDFVSLSDHALHLLARQRRKQAVSFYTLLLSPKVETLPFGDADRAKLKMWLLFLKRQFVEASLFESYPFLESAMHDFDIVGTSCRDLPPAVVQQQQANVDKFLGLALEWDESMGSSGLGMAAFLKRCDQLQLLGNKEPQALVASEDQGVHLMTVHAAKGLEFPMVIVGDLRRSMVRASPAILVNRQHEVGLRLNLDEVGSQATSAFASMDKAARDSAYAEELRILYVALSRAQERLLLTSGVTERLGPSWLKALGGLYDIKEWTQGKLGDANEVKQLPSFRGASQLDMHFHATVD